MRISINYQGFLTMDCDSFMRQRNYYKQNSNIHISLPFYETIFHYLFKICRENWRTWSCRRPSVFQFSPLLKKVCKVQVASSNCWKLFCFIFLKIQLFSSDSWHFHCTVKTELSVEEWFAKSMIIIFIGLE